MNSALFQYMYHTFHFVFMICYISRVYVEKCGFFLPMYASAISYKNNYRMECIHYANARHKVIIFCKSHPLNWQLEDNNQQRNQASSTTMTTRLYDTSLKGASSIVETFHLL